LIYINKSGFLTGQPGFALSSEDSMHLFCPIPKKTLPASNSAQCSLQCIHVSCHKAVY